MQQDMADAVRVAAQCLSSAGYAVEEVPFPRMQEAADLWRLLALNDSRRALLSTALQFGDEACRTSMLAMLEHAPSVDFETYAEGLEIGAPRSFANGCSS